MLMWPKPEKKKKRKKHRPSIMRTTKGICYLCEKNNDFSQKYTEYHHIFGGSNRDRSEEYGLTVYLCKEHHTDGKAAVHRNKACMDFLRKEGQERFERVYPELDFMSIFGKNYK